MFLHRCRESDSSAIASCLTLSVTTKQASLYSSTNHGGGKRRADIAGSLIVVASSIQKGANESDQNTDHYRGNDPIIVKNERVDHWPLGRQLGDIRREPTNAPFGESGEPLANTSIADEVREEYRRRVLRAVSGKRDHSGHTQMHNPERSHSRSCCADGRETSRTSHQMPSLAVR